MLPGILNQLGSESLSHLKSLVTNSITSPDLNKAAGGDADDDDDDDVPDLVENFDEASKDEAPTGKKLTVYVLIQGVPYY